MHVTLQASDGHSLAAYEAQPAIKATKAVVVLQEIFGVNSHIRSVSDGYARDGFWAIAPSLFDRVERGVELKYEPADTQRGMAIVKQIALEDTLKDISAAIDRAAAQVGPEHVAAVGYCWGGTLAWLAATRLQVAAAVGYYGGRTVQYAREKPRCPVMLHFGAKDAHIPPSEIDTIRQAHPQIPIYIYDAGHGFNCDQRKDFEPKSAALARERTVELLKKSV